MTVSAAYLLKGAVYALQQSGFLLRDANILYRQQSYASAVVLARFGQEELGRWKMLLRLRKEVIGGAQFSVDDVDDRCGDHVDRQKAGGLSTTLRGDNGGLRNLLKAFGEAAHGSADWNAARAALDEVVARKRKRMPEERHLGRMAALYVDPISPTEWNRPTEKITQEFARDVLLEASNDYSLEADQGYFNLEIVATRDAELADALSKWLDRPTLPAPEWPTAV